jgi:type II secretory pathway pseudopilin PulG
VVAILGVLAAIVIPNVGRFIGRGESEAAETEYANIQSAVVSMMTDCGVENFISQNLSTLHKGTGAGQLATNDMTDFPCDEYPLFGNTYHNYNVNYVATNTTKGTYTCDAYGTVAQATSGY